MHREVRGNTFPMGVRPFSRECLHQFSVDEGRSAENLRNEACCVAKGFSDYA
jgi:hypothetical protein